MSEKGPGGGGALPRLSTFPLGFPARPDHVSACLCASRPDRPGGQVVLCSDKGVSQTMMDHTMAHELIHAYDQCRVKLERSNCLHVACTEVSRSKGNVCYSGVLIVWPPWPARVSE